MQGKKKGFFQQFSERLSSAQKVYMIGLFTAAGFFLITWMSFSASNEKLKTVQLELSGARFNDRIRHLLQEAYLAKYQFNKASIGEGAGQEAYSLEELQQELELLLNFGKEFVRTESDSQLEASLDKIGNQFGKLGSAAEELDQLILALHALETQVTVYASLTVDPDQIVHELSDLGAREVATIQRSISQMVQKIKERVGGQKGAPFRDQLIGLMAVTRRELEMAEVKLLNLLRLLKEHPIEHRELSQNFTNFSQSTEQFLDKLEADAFSESFTKEQFLTVASDQILLLDKSFNFLEMSSEIAENYLAERERSFLIKQWATLLISAFFVLFGLGYSLHLTTDVLRSLRMLKNAADRITFGDLTARAPIFHEDEVGVVCRAFNEMAKSLQGYVEQSRALQAATRRLAQGDFTARLMLSDGSSSEVVATVKAFNKMAESFEEIVKRLQRLVNDLTSSATEIAASSKQQEANIIEQGATTKQIAMTATEISFTAKDFMNMMTDVMRTSDETSELVTKSQTGLRRMEVAMSAMESAAQMISSKLSVLSEKVDYITDVVTTITEVSKQTNLLSLNAAIEAQKAGEMGESFAVIAREIRTLSEETGKAAAHIEKIVNEIVDSIRTSLIGVEDFSQEIRKGSGEVSGVSQQLGKIIGQVKILTERYDAVGSGIASQTEAAEEIHEALQDLSQMAQESTLSMTQFLTTIEKLDKAAHDLRETFERLR